MLPGIRQCCRWSKLQRVSPCWTASNPPPTPPSCMWSGQGLVLRSGTVSFTPWPCWKVNLSLTLLVENSTYSYNPPWGIWGGISMGMFDRQPKGGAAPPKAGKATALPCSFPQFPISECASRQTAVTYQHDIVQLRFSCLPQSNENLCSMPLCFSFTCFHTQHGLNTKAFTLTCRGDNEKEWF